MTSEISTTTENEALLSGIEAVEQEVAAFKATLRRGHVARLLLFLTALAFVAGALWMFYQLAMQFKSRENLDLLMAKAQEHVNQSSDSYVKELQLMVENCAPVLSKTFYEQVKADIPKYTEAITKEQDELVDDLQARLGEQITARYQESGDRFQAILQEEFPEIDDPELLGEMSANVDAILEQLVQKYYSEQLRSELLEMYDTWDQFAMAEPAGKGAPSLEDQLIGNLLQLTALKLTGSPYLKDAPVENAETP